MKNLKNIRILAAILVTIFAFETAAVFAQRRPVIRRNTTRTSQLYNVERGTRIRVRMNDTLSSKTTRVGDRFTTTVTEPVYSTTGVIVVPTGSTVTGRVNNVTRAKKGGDPGTIDVSFVEVRLPNGTRRTINGTLTDLNADDAKSDNEGTASGDDRKNDKLIFIGGGAGGGAIIGGIIGGGKGALIGGIIGAVAGLAGERLTRGEDAKVEAGTEFGVLLNQGVNLPKFASVEDNDYNDPPPTTGGGRTYIVQRGDTLSKISQRFYGNTSGYMRIYEANRDTLSSPTRIEVGQELIIP